MKRVKLISDWDKTGQALIDQLALQSKSISSNVFKDMEFVTDNDYDHAVVFNFPRGSITSGPENTIGLLLEPPEIMEVMYGGKAVRTNYPQVGRYFSFAKQLGFEWAPFIGFGTVPDGDYLSLNKKKYGIL